MAYSPTKHAKKIAKTSNVDFLKEITLKLESNHESEPLKRSIGPAVAEPKVELIRTQWNSGPSRSHLASMKKTASARFAEHMTRSSLRRPLVQSDGGTAWLVIVAAFLLLVSFVRTAPIHGEKLKSAATAVTDLRD